MYDLASKWKVPFGRLVIGPTARKYLNQAISSNWITEGPFVREFEQRFAEKFGWKYAIATSSGTTAGEVIWSAIRGLRGISHDSLEGARIATPACAFVSTANCILAAGLAPEFIDIDIDTLNLAPYLLPQNRAFEMSGVIGIQFVATMGKPSPIAAFAELANRDDYPLYVVADWCEAHGATLHGERYADRYADASIYSFYVAHMIVGGEGGIICTDQESIADLCRSIKSHGRPSNSGFFDFQRPGFNAKWNDLAAAIALEGLENFDATFERRREIRQRFIDGLTPLEDWLILYRDAPGEIIAPHAIPIVLRDESCDIAPLRTHLESMGIEVKTLFGSLPTQHRAFRNLSYLVGSFPVAERIGRTGLHWGCHESYTNADVDYVVESVKEFFRGAA